MDFKFCSSRLPARPLAPGRRLNSGHLTNPSQLSCHVQFVSPLTVSLCPDQACTICSAALISLLPKNVGISPESPQARARPLHTYRYCIRKPLMIKSVYLGNTAAYGLDRNADWNRFNQLNSSIPFVSKEVITAWAVVSCCYDSCAMGVRNVKEKVSAGLCCNYLQ